MLQHSIPDKHLKSIGDITVSFALLELNIQLFIWSMLNEDQRIAQIITAELSFKNLRALMKSLYLEKYGKEDEDFDKLNKLMIRTGQVEDKRNQIIHSFWGGSRNTDTISRFKITAKEKDGIKFQFEEVPLDKLSDFATEIKVLAGDIQTYWISLMDKGKIKK